MIHRIGNALAVTVVLVAAWQALVTLAGLPVFILPGPVRVATALWDNAGLIAFHAGVTFTEVLVGLVLEWVFAVDRWYIVIALLALMTLIAAVSAEPGSW